MRGTILATVLAVLTTTLVVTAARGRFDVAGDAVDMTIDQVKSGDRPKPTKGVHLDKPDVDEETSAAGESDPPPVKAEKACGKATELEVALGVEKGSKVCRRSETSQDPDLAEAPRFELMKGAERAPEPKPAKPTTEPTDAPTADPSGTPDAETTDSPDEGDSDDGETDDPESPETQPTPSDDPSDESTAGPGERRAHTSTAAARGAVKIQPAIAPMVQPSGSENYLAPNWTQASTPSTPDGLLYPSMAYDPVRDKIVLFGGSRSNGTFSNETWVWNGSSWAQLSPATSPSARSGAAMAWDPSQNAVVLYGGRTSSTAVLSDVWSWNGTTWTQLSPSGTAPVARAEAAMAYDPVRGGLVIFGGRTSSADRNDTWQLKANAWTQLQVDGAGGAPARRSKAGLAYSTSTSQLVLFGGGTGTCPTCTAYGDTWILGATATSWSQQTTTHSPLPRLGHAMTFDPALDGIVVFGGASGNGTTTTTYNDTWAWTGSDWLHAAGIASPGSRAGAAMAANGDRQVVMFGGSNGSSSPETWTYSSALPILSITVGGPSGNVFYVGDTLQISITATNVGVTAIDATDGATITALLEGVGLTSGGQVKINNQLAVLCSGLIASTCAQVNEAIASVTNLEIAPLDTRVIDLVATVASTQRGCALVDVPALVSSVIGGSSTISTQITVCGGGLGIEKWWTFDTTDLGSGGTASVNVANGNLVLKQVDSTPVQTRGRLAMALGRAYNSQDLMTSAGPLGAGWQFDLGDTGEPAGAFGVAGLSLPNLQSATQPLSMPYVDRDGTRHIFKLRSVGATVGDINLPIDLTSGGSIVDKILNLLNLDTLPFALTSTVEGLTYSNLCIDQAYTGPPGSNMFLFRFIGVGNSAACANPATTSALTVGWSMVFPDRTRYDFNTLGDLERVTDATGQQLVYQYTSGVLFGPTTIYTKACGKTGTCPRLDINYNVGDAGIDRRRVRVTDSAGRITSYIVTTDPLYPQLLEVWDPGNPFSKVDGATPSQSFTYSIPGTPCPGSTSGATSLGQLCTVTDANGATTRFSYEPAPIGPDRVHKVIDRRGTVALDGAGKGLATTYTYHDDAEGQPAWVTADMAAPSAVDACSGNAACERVRYSDIDSAGRVGQIAEGSSDDVYLRQAGYFWDGDAIDACSYPTERINNNLCQTIRRAVPSNDPFTPGTAGTATVNGVTVQDEAVDYTYGDLGQLLRRKVLLDAGSAWTDANSSITTYGSHDQYFDANGTQRAYDNYVRGNGAIGSSSAAGNYRSLVLEDDPISYWRLDETSGTTMTDVKGINNGTYASGVTLGQDGIMPGNSAIRELYNGWSGTVTTPSSMPKGTTASGSDFTVETWVKPGSSAPEYDVQWGNLASNQYALVARSSGGLPYVALATNSAASEGAFVYAPVSIADGKYHHLVYTYDGTGSASGIAIWVDGVKMATTVSLDTMNGNAYSGTPTDLNTGYATDSSSNLDEVAIYGSVLTPARIKSHSRIGSGADKVEPDTLYAVTDQTQELSPRGNAATNWGDYLTAVRRDVPADGEVASTNDTAASTVCGAATRGNTGLPCEVDVPASNGVATGDCQSATGLVPPGTGTPPTSGSYAHTCTTYEYNSAGQRTFMRTPKAHASGNPDHYEYAYYDDVTTCSTSGGSPTIRNCDLSGSVSAGGWLKAVTDPNGKKVVYAYDSAGSVARTWDRNATEGHALSEAWTDPVTPPSAKFTESVGSTPVTSDALSVSNTALITAAPDGTVFGSGTNGSGELGDGTTTARPTGVAAAPMSNVVQIVQSALGSSMGCAYTIYRTGSGEVWAAGGGITSTPAKVAGLADIIQVAVGGCHTMALDASGDLWVFGQNGAGQVGNGTTSTVLSPVKVLSGVATITAGMQHTLAVKTDGTVWAWGNNAAGQLGLGNTTSGHTTPTQVPGLSGVRAVAGGTDASYAIGRDGSVWAWGGNASGQLGIGNTTTKTSPTRITTLGSGTAIGAVHQIIGGNAGAAALLRDGTVRAWGLGSSGQLGSGTASASSPTAVPGLTGQVAIAGGWNTLASANKAGKVTVWGATANHQLGTGSNPATSTPVTAGIDISPYRLPWRFTRSARTPTGDLSTAVVDRLGNVRSTRPGRGNDVFSAAYDFSSKYDAAQRQIWSITAENRAGAKNASTEYDAFGNPVKSIDARGIAFRATFDAVNRRLTSKATRGTVGVPTTCTETATSASWTSGQNGHMVCTSSATYDGLDHQVTMTDANSQVSKNWFDAAGRTVRQDVPRNVDGYSSLSTRQVYDRDGNVTDVCPPRQFDAANESSTTSGCTSTGVYSSHQVFDRSGRVTSQTKYRSATALTNDFEYDADGNVVSATDANGHKTETEFNLLGRRTAQSVPRTATISYETRWSYDPSGNVTSVRSPGSLNTGSGADGSLVVDGTTAANSTDGVVHGAASPFQVPDGAQYRNVTLQNGGRITSANANGLMFHVSGKLTVCSTCVITMAGKGRTGGAAATNATNPNPGNGGLKGGDNLLATGSGGGGGGHKTAGSAGGGSNGGAAGLASGTIDFTDVGTAYLQGAGGGGGGGGRGILANNAGVGGNGGGYVRIAASEIVVNGLIDASGNDGGTGVSNAAGGGGGAGGGIWLAAPDISLASASVLDVTGGVGGGPANRAGGAGASGYVRIEADNVTNAPVDADRSRAARLTAYSYDAANRLVDIVEGSQTTQADANLDNSAGAAPDANGFQNTRTRHFYDADGQIAAILPPQAFSNAASLTAPNLTTIRRVDHDLDGREVASYSPRYDTAVSTVTSIGGGDDGGTGVNQQTSQCAADRVVDAVPGLGSYPSTVGVCVARTTYDPAGNVARRYLPTSNGSDNRYLENSYTGDNLVRVVSGPDPNSSGRVDVATNEYDGAGRVTKVTDALGHASQTSYTADGLVYQSTGQAYTVGSTTVTSVSTYGYDANGNSKTVTNPNGDVTTQSWSSDNLLSQIKAPGKDGSTFNTTVYGYDNVGNPTSVLMPQQQADGTKAVVNEFFYDNLLKATHTPITNSSYRSVRYAYAPAGMKVATTTARCSSGSTDDCVPANNDAWHPLPGEGAGTMRLTYGANGRVADQIGRDSSSITTQYSQDGKPKQITDPTSAITITAGYYLDGMVRTVGDGTNDNTYAYDAGGQTTVRSDKTALTGVTAGVTKSTSYFYNQAGLPGQMSSQVLDLVTAYEYDDAGRLITETSGDHINDMSYHPNNALAGLRTRAGGNTVNEFVYEYDNNGHMTKQVATGDSEKYTNNFAYNPAGNVSSWTHAPTGGTSRTTEYSWDRNNNRTRAKFMVSGQADQITDWVYKMDNSIQSVDTPTDPLETFTYDNAGRLEDDNCNTYTYDDFDRIKTSTISGTTACGGDSRTVTYTYDGLDRQRTIAVTGSASGNGTTSSLFDGLSSRLVGQKDATNGANSKPEVLYQHDAGGTAMGMEQTGASALKSFLDTDGHGNVVNQVTTADARACAVVYDPFGGAIDAATGGNDMCAASPPTTTATSTTGNAIWYRGQVRDSSTGDYQLGTRSYDPTSGSFTTPDSYRVASSTTDVSVGVDPATANTYVYVNGNPVNYSDPTGHWPDWLEDAADATTDWIDDRKDDALDAGGTVLDKTRNAAGGLVGGFAEVGDLLWMLTPSSIQLTQGPYGVPGFTLEQNHKPVLKDWWYDTTGVDKHSTSTTIGEWAPAVTGVGGLAKGVVKKAATKWTERKLAQEAAEITARKTTTKATTEAAEETASTVSTKASKPPTSTKAAKPEGSGPAADAAPEVFYRGMSHAEARGLSNAGGLSVRGESFVTQNLGYVEQLAARHPSLYETIIRFEMAPGTTDALLSAGARGPGRLLDDVGLGGMHQIQSGMTDAVHVKAELGAVNYGLRSGSVDIFNSRILGLGALR